MGTRLSDTGSVDKSTHDRHSYVYALRSHIQQLHSVPSMGHSMGIVYDRAPRIHVLVVRKGLFHFGSSGLMLCHTVSGPAPLATSSCPNHVTVQWMAPNSDAPAFRGCSTALFHPVKAPLYMPTTSSIFSTPAGPV